MLKNGKTSDKYDISDLIGRGTYLELNNINYNLIKEGDIVFLSTNHDENAYIIISIIFQKALYQN